MGKHEDVMLGGLARIASILLISVLTPLPSLAEEKPEPPHWSDALKNIPIGPLSLDIGGSLRYRYERQDDFNVQRYADDRDGFTSDSFLLQRARLDFNLKMGKDARAYVELQDALVYDSDFTRGDFDWHFYSCPYWDLLDLRQAYLEWLHIGDTPFGFKVGRQAISYADYRIWGPGEWGNVGRYTWDAVKLIADTEPAEIHAIFGNRVRYHPSHFDEHDRHLDAYGFYGMVKKLPFRLDLFWLWKKTQPDMVVNAKGDALELDTHTLGLHIDGRFGSGKQWDYGGTLAHTLGDRATLISETVQDVIMRTATDYDVRAWGGNVRLGYTFDHPWEPRVGVEYSHGSGGSNLPGDDYETFDGAFGGIDTTKYGWMNFFSWMNLHDYEVALSCKPVSKTRIALEYHFFRLDDSKDAWYWSSGRAARQDATGGSGSSVGQELDLTLAYDYSKHMKFLIGYAHFLPGRFLRRTGDSPDADWFFVQVHYSF